MELYMKPSRQKGGWGLPAAKAIILEILENSQTEVPRGRNYKICTSYMTVVAVVAMTINLPRFRTSIINI